MQFVLMRNITELANQWIGFSDIVPRVMDFEGLKKLDLGYFHNLRNPPDRLNIRNADTLIPNPTSNDQVFTNYNLNNTGSKRTIYAHPTMATINNGNPLTSLQDCINRGARVRYVTNKISPENFNQGDVIITSEKYRAFNFSVNTPLSTNNVEFYDVWIKDLSDPENVINRFFPYQEIQTGKMFINGLKDNTDYELQVQAVDVFFNKNERSTVQIKKTIPLPALATNSVAIYIMNETNGNLIDRFSSNNGTLEGTINRNGNGYKFSSGDAMVTILDNDDFTFTDGNTNLVDFTIRVIVDFDADNNFSYFISKREFNTAGVQEWQLRRNNGSFQFNIWDENNNLYTIGGGSTPPNPITLGVKYDLVVTCINRVLSLYLDGVLIEALTIPTGINFFNGVSPVEIGNASFTAFGNGNHSGTNYYTHVLKNRGYTAQEVVDVYNNGNHLTF